jgi:hypothetical protein
MAIEQAYLAFNSETESDKRLYYCLLGTIYDYDAGHIRGIIEERAKRKVGNEK